MVGEKKFLYEIAKRYPRKDMVMCEIVRLNSLLHLPKGTEHFISDIHGEYEALSHILRNASGVIRRKIKALFGNELSECEIAELAALVYYPEEKLSLMREDKRDMDSFLSDTMPRLILLCHTVSLKYPRTKVKGRLTSACGEYADIINELISCVRESEKQEYRESIYKSLLRCGSAEKFIEQVCRAARALVVDRLHVVGDIFDRGARADVVLDELMCIDDVDIQWGNHDALWMGAAAGSGACIAAVINNSITYKNLDVLEIGYGISLRPLALFAAEEYENADISPYMPKGNSGGSMISGVDEALLAKMHKAISVIQFKLEGELIKRHPEFLMDDRLLLDKIDTKRGVVDICGREYPLRDSYFPTLDKSSPYSLTDKERAVISYLQAAFVGSEKLRRHILFLYKAGGMYKCSNRNLIFHGCIPLADDGSFLPLSAAGGLQGRALMDYCDKAARGGYFAKCGTEERLFGEDFLWFLWCGRNSPLCARARITTFERLLVDDKSTWHEPRNAYYRAWDDEKIVDMILKEFGISGAHSHIINGHIPVKKGEPPIKAGGRLIVIDGGFCSAYHGKTGIGGYTLIYNADGMRISAHKPFVGREDAIKKNIDIISDTVIFERATGKIRVRETDEGNEIREKISDLIILLREYESGNIKEGEYSR